MSFAVSSTSRASLWISSSNCRWTCRRTYFYFDGKPYISLHQPTCMNQPVCMNQLETEKIINQFFYILPRYIPPMKLRNPLHPRSLNRESTSPPPHWHLVNTPQMPKARQLPVMQGSEINSDPCYIIKLQIFHKILGHPFEFLWANFILD